MWSCGDHQRGVLKTNDAHISTSTTRSTSETLPAPFGELLHRLACEYQNVLAENAQLRKQLPESPQIHWPPQSNAKSAAFEPSQFGNRANKTRGMSAFDDVSPVSKRTVPYSDCSTASTFREDLIDQADDSLPKLRSSAKGREKQGGALSIDIPDKDALDFKGASAPKSFGENEQRGSSRSREDPAESIASPLSPVSPASVDIYYSDRSMCDSDFSETVVRPLRTPAAASGGTRSASKEISNKSKQSEHSELEVLPIWPGLVEKRNRRKSSRDDNRISLQPSSSSLGMWSNNSDFEERSWLQNVVFRPNSWCCIFWDIITVCAMVVDLVFIPLDAFGLPRSHPFFVTVDWGTAVIWLSDIFASFFTGFSDTSKGIIELRPKAIFWRYVQTWFAFDTCVVVVDWALLVTGEAADWIMAVRLLRSLRLLRLFKIANARLIPRIMSLTEVTNSETLVAVVSIMSLMLGLCAINHFIASGWYAIGSLSGGDHYSKQWTDSAFELDSTLFYRYTTAFHWSLTQFTPASMEVVPKNGVERVYNLVIILFGMLMFSSFVGSMTNWMNYLRQLSLERRQQMQTLQRYVGEHNVSAGLATCIMGFIRQSQQKQRRLREGDIPAFRALPESLLIKLHLEVYSPTLLRHPLMRQLADTEESFFQNICHFAMSESTLVSGEEVFQEEQEATAMYFIVGDSRLDYHYRGPDYISFGTSGEERGLPVIPGQWLCEAVLWVQWEHRGRLVASSDACHIYKLKAADFQTVAAKHKLVRELAEYAKRFAVAAVKENDGCSDLITDLYGSNIGSIRRLVAQAFKTSSGSESLNKLMFLWGGDYSIKLSSFQAWKAKTKELKWQHKYRHVFGSCCGFLRQSS